MCVCVCVYIIFVLLTALSIGKHFINIVVIPIAGKVDITTELVRHFLIESTKKGCKLKGCKEEPVFGESSSARCSLLINIQLSRTPFLLLCSALVWVFALLCLLLLCPCLASPRLASPCLGLVGAHFCMSVLKRI